MISPALPGIHRQNRGFYFLKRNLCFFCVFSLWKLVTVHSYLVPVTDFADASHSKSAKSAATTVSYGIFSSENACLWTVTSISHTCRDLFFLFYFCIIISLCYTTSIAIRFYFHKIIFWIPFFFIPAFRQLFQKTIVKNA